MVLMVIISALKSILLILKILLILSNFLICFRSQRETF